MKILNHAIILTTKGRGMIYGCYIVVSCPNFIQANNGLLNCSLGDDGVSSYEDICSFTCNTGYELIGSEIWFCQSDGSWSSSNSSCRGGM